MINNIVIMGRLTKDAEERKTNSGKSVCSFCVALDDRFDKEKTHFIDVIAWNNTAEFVCKYFHKGSMIAVQGRLTTRNWEDKNGSKHKAVEIVADEVSFCGDKKSDSAPMDIVPEDGEEDIIREIPGLDLPF
jgi:single-strand DNA-binding protein